MGKKRVLGWIAPLLVLGVSLVGCPTATVVTIDPPVALLNSSETVDLTAASTSQEDASFDWAVSDSNVLTLSSATGKTVTVTGLAAGTARVTATGSVSGAKMSAVITVAGVQNGGVTVVTLNPAQANAEVGDTFTLTANSTSASDTTFNWTVSNGTVATLNTNAGKTVTVTAAAAGETNITATGSFSGKTSTVHVVVVASTPDTTQPVVSVNPAQAVLTVGETYDISAASTESGDSFNWTTSDANVAELSATTGGTVTVTALAVGQATVTTTGSVSGKTSSLRIAVVAEDQTPVVIPGSQLAPGLNVSIDTVTIPEDRRALIHFTATDDDGNLVGKKELGDVRFILAYLEPAVGGETDRFVSYTTRTENPDGVANNGDEEIQGTLDSGRLAATTQNADGSMTYRMAKAMPENYIANLTHQVSGQIVREYVVDGKEYIANPVFTFRPDGQAVTKTREIVDTATCNECHVRMGFHGGERREIQYCILCHTPQTTDANSGNTVDMPVMVHKIHMGEELPSVKGGTDYVIVGNANTEHNYSTVVFPQDPRNCESCHGEDGDRALQASFYKNNPTIAACGSCHDRTWFGDPAQMPAGYTLHENGGPYTDSSACAVCHTAANITVKHRTEAEKANAPGLALGIKEVHPDANDGTLTIVFTANDGAGNPITDLAPIERVGATFAYPVPEYGTYKSEVIKGSGATGVLASTTSPNGEYTFTFANKLPVGTDYTFAVGMEGRRQFTYKTVTYRQGTETNGLTVFTTDGSEPVERRQVVDEASCLKCHGKEMRMHGENRVGVDYCLLCHNPNTTDESRRPAPQMPPVTVNLKDMLHRIHSGENLEVPYIVYGYGGTPADFSEVRYPADRRNCASCHAEDTQLLPTPEEAAPTVVTQAGNPVSTIHPQRAACTSCHDSIYADVHAYLNTSSGGVETCAVCHGEGTIADVKVVHEIEP